MRVEFYQPRDHLKPLETINHGVTVRTNIVPAPGDTVTFDEGNHEYVVARRCFYFSSTREPAHALVELER